MLDSSNILFYHYELPRTLLALVCGASMGLAGVLIQLVIRNPFASPATLGINAGAMLGVTIAAVGGTQVGISPIGGLLGGLCAGILTLTLSKRLGDSPIHTVLIGMIVNLGLNGIAALLLLFNENSLDGLYIWGAGNLHLHNYLPLTPLSLLLAVAIVMCIPFCRALDLFSLGEGRAASLGVSVKLIQWFALITATILAASVCSVVGMISFIGLIAPHLANGCGAKTSWQKGVLSILWGAVLLLLADWLARWMGGDSISVPAGALTTLIGAPCLIYFLFRNKNSSATAPSKHNLSLTAVFNFTPQIILSSLFVIALLGIYINSTYSQTVLGPNTEIFDLRWPRILFAFCAGVGLAGSGLILQLFMRNPLASPDVTGLTHCGVLSVVLVGTMAAGLSQFNTVLISILGSSIGLVAILWLNRGGHFSPVRLALTGIAITAMASTITPMVFALSANQSTDALMWLSGTTYTATPASASFYFFLSLILLTPFVFTWRWLNLLQLGNEWASSLGLSIQQARIFLLVIVSLLSGIAVALVGGITFIGLMAPHGARLLGVSDHKYLLPITLLLGGTLLIWADFIAQQLMFPYELPTGLLVSLIGGLYFIVLMSFGIRVQK